MKICVITANIGGFDEQRAFPEQIGGCDFKYFDDQNLPYPMRELRKSPRFAAKYFKLQAHRIFPDYDIYIWLDGRVAVTSPYFVSNYAVMLRSNAIITTTHPERKNVYDELGFMIKNSNIKWMTDRYIADDTRRILDDIKEQVPEDFPLFSAGIFARNGEATNQMFDEWWNYMMLYNMYDQAWFSYLIWKYKLRYGTIDYYNRFFRVEEHRKR